jgi:2-haloalkanoic acid dehalogenase type II
MTDFDRYRALSFDCYGTLIDWESGLLAELRPWADRHGSAKTDDELLAAFGAAESSVQQEQPAALYPDLLAESLRRVGAVEHVAVTDAEAADFGTSVGRWPAFPDSAEALARLKARYRLIILSNVDRASFAASNERLGVAFDLVVTAQDVGAYKPSPKSFPALFERLPDIGVAREELLHVAQSLYHDHEPARAVGLPCVWIDRRGGRAGAGATPPVGGALPEPTWRYASLAAFADDALAKGTP